MDQRGLIVGMITDWTAKYAIKPNGVIHVGASIGEEVEEWNRLTKRVAWIEPNPALWPELERRTATYGHKVLRCAAGETETLMEFNISDNPHSSSLLPLGRHKEYYPHIGYAKTVRVHVLPLDILFDGSDDYDYLYMDVQGYEGQVLLGATKLLPKIRWIYAEYNEEEMYSGCWLMPQLTSWLADRQFVLKEKLALHSAWGDALFIRA